MTHYEFRECTASGTGYTGSECIANSTSRAADNYIRCVFNNSSGMYSTCSDEHDRINSTSGTCSNIIYDWMDSTVSTFVRTETILRTDYILRTAYIKKLKSTLTEEKTKTPIEIEREEREIRKQIERVNKEKEKAAKEEKNAREKAKVLLFEYLDEVNKQRFSNNKPIEIPSKLIKDVIYYIPISKFDRIDARKNNKSITELCVNVAHADYLPLEDVVLAKTLHTLNNEKEMLTIARHWQVEENLLNCLN